MCFGETLEMNPLTLTLSRGSSDDTACRTSGCSLGGFAQGGQSA